MWSLSAEILLGKGVTHATKTVEPLAVIQCRHTREATCFATAGLKKQRRVKQRHTVFTIASPRVPKENIPMGT